MVPGYSKIGPEDIISFADSAKRLCKVYFSPAIPYNGVIQSRRMAVKE
ncbi:MAG: hypothetical protein LBE10_12650 [Treponema sp.]|nr:hypothetical protein [Treponema sp.]